MELVKGLRDDKHMQFSGVFDWVIDFTINFKFMYHFNLRGLFKSLSQYVYASHMR